METSVQGIPPEVLSLSHAFDVIFKLWSYSHTLQSQELK